MTQTPIYTIGYGHLTIDEFITRLQEREIAYLIDVRSQPYSRYKPDFAKEALAAQLDCSMVKEKGKHTIIEKPITTSAAEAAPTR